MLLDLDFDVATDNLKPADVPAEAYHRIAQFLYREARLLDERRYADWHALWTEDGMYWMPRVPGQKSPYDHVSLFWEDRMLRDVRIRRLEHPRNWSQQPPTRSARLVGGVQIEGVDAGGNLVVHSAFQMTEWRKRQPRQLAGRYTHKLAADGDGWRIRMKRVDLVNCDDAHDAFEVFV
ncbi:aromatic-ring-hydroxylating dioxygenase subunit beta [Achromobacter sp. AONIH1]|jgi:benzoate/toluate 1,2-dioxygenase beta subunit|uniref:aromatic-ring-hydroxylating dioxygenase subunit beta n=1 Tax=unclassified Achromobacter TaxID=2626865 RepID=UPI000CD1C34C|nr:aromatic-ring-hydroxylating dioxygenase subunit beta [Achromobacter sp. AONIH1]AUT45879.1 aromatic-ring-hydroxylating dioxygenase subunit beta [Achromobacter sp. AONIH1]